MDAEPADHSREQAREHARKLSKSHRSTMPPRSVPARTAPRAAKINARVVDSSAQLRAATRKENLITEAAHAGSGSPKEHKPLAIILKIERMMQLTKARLPC